MRAIPIKEIFATEDSCERVWGENSRPPEIQRFVRTFFSFGMLLFVLAGCGSVTATPKHQKTYSGAPVLEIEAVGNLVFIAQRDPAGLQIYQRASDGKRGLLKHGHARISGQPTAVAGTALRAFVATTDPESELAILNLNDLDHPSVVGTYDAPSQQSGTAIFASGNSVYLGTTEDPTAPEVFILDVSEMSAPQQTASFDLRESVTEIHVEGGFAYIGSRKGLHILSIEDLSALKEVAFLPVGHVTGLDINSGRALLTTASHDENFFVIDLEEPESASTLHSGVVGTEATDIEAYHDTAYVSGRDGIYILDTSSEPNIIGSHETAAPLNALDVAHGTLYAISTEDRTLVVLDPGVASGQAISDLNGDGEILISHLGDSNTALEWSGLETWSEVSQRLYDREGLDWKIDATQAIGGATVADFGIFLPPRHLAAWSQLERTLKGPTPDVFIFSFVTNDMRFWSEGMLPHKSIREIAGAYREHAASIATFDPEIPIFITTSPPLHQNRDRQLRFNLSAMNDAIFEAYPARQIIDTFSALDSQIDLGEDGIHLSQAGHDLRAELVVQKLTLGQ